MAPGAAFREKRLDGIEIHARPLRWPCSGEGRRPERRGGRPPSQKLVFDRKASAKAAGSSRRGHARLGWAARCRCEAWIASAAATSKQQGGLRKIPTGGQSPMWRPIHQGGGACSNRWPWVCAQRVRSKFFAGGNSAMGVWVARCSASHKANALFQSVLGACNPSDGLSDRAAK